MTEGYLHNSIIIIHFYENNIECRQILFSKSLKRYSSKLNNHLRSL
jgi:hypothetical protein